MHRKSSNDDNKPFLKKPKFIGKLKLNNSAKAFPSDTYVKDLKRASNAKKPWVHALQLVVIISALADFLLLQDAFAWALDQNSLMNSKSLLDFIWHLPASIICVVLVVLYLLFCRMTGRKLAEFRAFHEKTSMFAAVSLLLAVVVTLSFIAVIRYMSIFDEITNISSSSQNALSNGFGGSSFGGFGNSSSDDSNLTLEFNTIAFTETIALICVMVLGACLETIISYYSYDPFAGEKKRLTEGYIAEDKALYESVFAKFASDYTKNVEYERQERMLDKRTVECAFLISELSSQLNGIVDPADAFDFVSVSRIINQDYAGR